MALVVNTKYPLAGMDVLFNVALVPVDVLVTAEGVVVTLVKDVTSVPYPILYVTDAEDPFTTAITLVMVLANEVNAKHIFSALVGVSRVSDLDHTWPLYPLHPEIPE